MAAGVFVVGRFVVGRFVVVRCVAGASVVFLFLYPLIMPAGGFGFVSQARPFGRMRFSSHPLKLAAGALVVCV